MPAWVKALTFLLFATLGSGDEIEPGAAAAVVEDAVDFTSFITRPEIKAPLFEVTNYAESTPGYWFVAPYLFLVSQEHSVPHSELCTIGPMIYDNAGELVWSGACLANNTNTFDFRAWQSEGEQYVSAILDSQTKTGVEQSRAIILDKGLQITTSYHVPDSWSDVVLNMHEFNPIGDGKTVLHIVQRSVQKDVSLVEHSTGEKMGRIVDNGFAEINLLTRQVLFEWWASDHIALSASSGVVAGLSQKPPRGWNWIHINSVDKNEDGDYMISARYTNSLYKVSGQTGEIIWTLGGLNSSFELQAGLNFSRQHDARFVSQANGIEVVSLLDNGGDDHDATALSSSGILVALNTATFPKTAAVVKRFVRPSGGVSKQRGNFQRLPNGNVFIGWSDQCHISEYNPSGKLLLEARWTKQISNTYRAWKFNFTSDPLEDPVLKASVQGREAWSTPKTVFHVSWNGATEVAFWNFRRSTLSNGLIGSRRRTGFETSFEVVGCESKVYAEAVSQAGKVVRRSAVEIVNDADNLCSSTDVEQQLLPEEITDQNPAQHTLGLFSLNYTLLACSATITIFLGWRCLRWMRRRWLSVNS